MELGDNNLISLLEDMGVLSKLEILNLSRNNLFNLLYLLGDLFNLKMFDLSGNKIENLLEKFYFVNIIENFFIDNNYLKFLFVWFGQLSYIKNLGIADNELLGNFFLDFFGVVFGKILKILDFFVNNILNLLEIIGDLKKLEKLKFGSIICELERRVF